MTPPSRFGANHLRVTRAFDTKEQDFGSLEQDWRAGFLHYDRGGAAL
jgi:hypothetical protein